MRRDKVVQEVLGDENVITPSDLCHHDLKRVTMGGYRPEEVDELLERVADVMENLIEQIRRLKYENESLRERLAENRESETLMRDALVATQRSSETILEAARSEAHAIIEEARAETARINLERARIPETLANEIRLLEQQRERFRTQFIAVLETHRRLLDDLVPPLPPAQTTLSTPGYVPESTPSHVAEAGVDGRTADDADDNQLVGAAWNLPMEPVTNGEDHKNDVASDRDDGALGLADLISPSRPEVGVRRPQDRPARVDLEPDTEAELKELMARVAESRHSADETVEAGMDAGVEMTDEDDPPNRETKD